MADILCPHCNMPNPDDQNICSFCRQPMHIAADNEAIHPGDMPTKKTTAELEPILPQWLRDARTMARESAEEDEAEQAAESAKPAAETPGPADWLAGLEAAAKDDEDEAVPDWMRGMAPEKPAPAAPKRETPPPPKEITLTKRHEISWDDEPTPTPRATEPPPTGPLGATQSEDGIPYWLKNMNAEEEASEEKKEVSDFLAQKEQPAPPQGNTSPFESGTFRPNTGELINWLDKMSPQVGEAAPSMPSADVPASEPLPDWISKLESEPAAATPAAAENEFNFDWLKEESSKPFVPFQPSQMAQEIPPAEETEEPAATELPDWMKPAAGASEAPLSFASLEPAAEETPAAAPQAEAPDWLSSMAAQASEENIPAAENLPDWLSKLDRDSSAAPAEQTASGLPDWMQTREAETPVPASSATEEGLPDWIKPAMETPASQAEEAAQFDWMKSSAVTPPPAEAPSALPSVPAFMPGDTQTSDMFAVDMPDWLSSIAPAEVKSAAASLPKAEAAQSDSIAPADLPSWVQAMRPVEAALPGTPATQEPISRPAEVDGPLAGLRGVLPDMPGVNVAGKPRTYSIRLEPSTDQQQNAALLEKLIEAETQARPMRGTSFLLGAQRVLRWTITAVLVLLVTLVLFGRTQLTPLPAALTSETYYALQAVNTVPPEAQVLLVFDYEPALSGELEASAASLLDYLTVARNPNYSVLSTSPTGAALANRFLGQSDLIAAERVTQLGYLPGESAGILAFAMNPRAARPLAQNVNAYSDYALVILLTDRAESARAWVEQTSAYTNGRPLVVVSSAQAAPMIQPYLISGQVNGLVNGLHGGAELEDELALPGRARLYWDAYNFAMIAVTVMIFIGAIWNFALGRRARRQEQADA